MANHAICVNVSCDRPALYFRRTLCQLHYRNPRATGELRKAPAPTTLSEWEWIKKELKL